MYSFPSEPHVLVRFFSDDLHVLEGLAVGATVWAAFAFSVPRMLIHAVRYGSDPHLPHAAGLRVGVGDFVHDV